MSQMKITPIQDEFKKVTYPFLKKEDFDKGPLGFLVQTRNGDPLNHNGVTIGSKIGTIFTARATYDGLKNLDNDPEVISIEYSRPGGMI